ncbi:MAG: DNA polymerase III subunit delta [Bacteroidales bacterium]|nr:DNA polymerase III subunit delta [Bacteroidales bacterium]
MEYKDLAEELKKGHYRNIYFFHGKEPYFIDRLTHYIQENALSESERSFNQTILYGKDTDTETVINTAKRYPMMAQRQVVIVKEAQNLKGLEKLLYYLQKPQQKTILVISYKYGSLDKRTRLYKALKDPVAEFESKKIPDHKVPEWILKYIKKRKLTMDSDAAVLMTEFLGNDLDKITHELDKLLLALPNDQTHITSAHIEKNIGISKEYNPFELNKALAEKNVVKANRIIRHFGKNPSEYAMPMIIGSMYFFFSKVLGYHFLTPEERKNKYKVATRLKAYPNSVWQYEKATKKYSYQKAAHIISYLREYDMKSKGVNNVSASEEDLLKELVFKILH